MKKFSLNGAWLLTRLATGETYPATVPGVVHTVHIPPQIDH